MATTINRNMKIRELKQILNDNGIDTPFGWEIVLFGLFAEYNTDTAEIIGFGSNAKFSFKGE